MKIKSLFVVSIICFFSTGVFAESGDAATGLCKDGTSYTGKSKKGACRGHKGIKEWYADKEVSAAKEETPAKAATTKEETAPAASAGGAATGLCKDGTLYTGASKKGACRGHKGLKEWYAEKETPAAKQESPAKTAAPAAAASTSGVATGLCKDGTEYTGTSKKGACRGHKGVKEWYADKQTPAAKDEKPAVAAATTAPATEAVATGLCKDGTVYTGASKKGACRGHKGVKEWYADKQAPAAKDEKPAAAPAAAPAEEETEAPAPPSKATAPAPAAGSGKVWVNTRSKIYHCEGTKYYGNTKEGEYMSEPDAQAKGFVANRKKVCNQ